jgi:enoyl-[acyl-carrier protein] reductase III
VPEPLEGEIALVTGASRGIGRAIARRLAAAGCDVVVNYYLDHQAADAACAEVRALGRRAVAIQADVAKPESQDELFARLRDELGRLDVMVSNAASGVLEPLLESSVKHWRFCLETNAFALVLLAQRALDLMPPGGRIVALSSLGASRALPGYGLVGASKAALESLVRTLAVELGPRRIRVNAVSAGVVDTDALRAFAERDALRAAFAARAPLGEALTADAVAAAVLLLCLPESAAITGSTVVVDGGYSIAG